jgi:hypothetical protein
MFLRTFDLLFFSDHDRPSSSLLLVRRPAALLVLLMFNNKHQFAIGAEREIINGRHNPI